MADQNTTVAQLPAGYATLAGVIYAVAATSPKSWSYCVWTRISACLTPASPANNSTIQSASRTQRGKPRSPRAEVYRRLSSQITKHVRSLRKQSPGADQSLAQRVALLHLLCSFPESQTLELQNGSTDYDLESAQASVSSSTKVIAANGINKTPSPIVSPVLSQDLETFAEIAVHLRGANGLQQEILITLSTKDARQILTQEMGSSINLLSNPVLLDKLVHYSKSEDFNTSVFVQTAASFEAFVIEIVYKGIEILFACGVILGSSGGAWLGQTLASMFPARIAAGSYSSAYGQRLSRSQAANLKGVHLWRSTGTIWTDCELHSYELLPCCYLADKWRDAIGYSLQYAALFVIQLYKLELRTALDFGDYKITRDAIRYILLVIQFFIFLLYFSIVRKRHTRSKEKETALRPSRDIIASVVYAIAQSAGIVCVILGQKDFLKPIWKFYLTSKIIDPIAAVGAVAVMTLGQQRGMKVTAEKWVLLWALGACTVVW